MRQKGFCRTKEAMNVNLRSLNVLIFDISVLGTKVCFRVIP